MSAPDGVMPPALKVALVGGGIFLASLALAVACWIGIALFTGKSVAAGERAVLAAGACDLLLVLIALVAFWLASRPLGTMARVLATGALAFAELAAMAVLFVLTVLSFNR